MKADRRPPTANQAGEPLQLVNRALLANHGPRDWRDWKKGAARDMAELATRAERMGLLEMDLTDAFRVRYTIQMPVPRWPVDDRLVIGDYAIFDLHYEEQWRWESPPSMLPLAIRVPTDLFHPNCQPALLPGVASELSTAFPFPFARAVLCTGSMPAGTLPREFVLLGYFAASLQLRVLDELDPQGILNPVACDFYRRNPHYLPLTKAGLYDPWPRPQGESHERVTQPPDQQFGHH